MSEGKTYTREQVSQAMNAGADMVLGDLDLDGPEADAVNLAVNAAMTLLDSPGATFARVVKENYDESPKVVRGWFS